MYVNHKFSVLRSFMTAVLAVALTHCTWPGCVQSQEKGKQEREKYFMGFPVKEGIAAPPTFGDEALKAIWKIKETYEEPAIDYLQKHKLEIAGKYIIDEEIDDRIAVLDLLGSSSEDAIRSLLPYIEMRTPNDLNADSEYFVYRYPALYSLISIGRPAVPFLYNQLCRKSTTKYRVRLITSAMLYINFFEVMGGGEDDDKFNIDLENAKNRTRIFFEEYRWRSISDDNKDEILRWIDRYELWTELPEEIPGLVPLDIRKKMEEERQKLMTPANEAGGH